MGTVTLLISIHSVRDVEIFLCSVSGHRLRVLMRFSSTALFSQEILMLYACV